MKFLFILFLSTLVTKTKQQLSFTNNSPYVTLFKRQFTLFDVWVDCRERLPIIFYYKIDRDVGNFPRQSTFNLDPTVPASCQQLTSNAYSNSGYDRGHLVPANHVDQSQQALVESNYMTNIGPQVAAMNRGAWLLTEEIIECRRDLGDVLNVYGGIVMGNDITNDIFKNTHGIRTPDFYWKIIENTRTKDVIAWIVPNSATAIKANLNQYATTIANIETKSGFLLNNFSSTQKTKLQSNWQTNWSIPSNCDYS